MKIVTNKEFCKIEKCECVLIVECTKTRKCGWKGTELEYGEKKISEIEIVNTCPRCGNDEFFMSWIPVSTFTNKYLKK